MNQPSKFLLPLAMCYMMLKIVTVLLIYKIVTIGSITTTAATLIIPLWFLIGDIIAEVYGYNVSKQIIWAALFFQIIFAFICTYSIKLPSPSTWSYQTSYNQVLGNTLRVAFASCSAIMCGAFLNSFYLSKWKVLLNGRFFWLRSLGASIIGEAVFTFVAFSMEFFGVVSFKIAFELMAISFAAKLIINPLLVIPSSLLAAYIKKKEGFEVFDYDIEFNPFKLSTSKRASNDALIIPIR